MGERRQASRCAGERYRDGRPFVGNRQPGRNQTLQPRRRCKSLLVPPKHASQYMSLGPASRICFSRLRLACKKLRLLFGLAEKHRRRPFSAEKIRILQNLRLNVWQKALIVSLMDKVENAVHNNC